MSDERRWLLFFVVLIGSMAAYSLIFKPKPQPPAPAATTAPAPDAAAAESVATPAPAEPPAAAPDTGVAEPPAAEAIVASTQAAVRFESAWGDLVLDNKGARLTSVLLRGVDPPEERGGEPRHRELISDLALGSGIPPLALRTGDAALDAWMDQGLWQVEARDADGARILTARLADGKGVSAMKELTLRADRPYLAEFRAGVTRGGVKLPVDVVIGPSLGPPAFTRSSVYIPKPMGVAEWNGKVRNNQADPKKGAAKELKDGAATWAGVEENYFAWVFLPGEPDTTVTLQQKVVEAKNPDNTAPDAEAVKLALPWTTVSVPADGGLMYLGPKRREALAAADARFVPLSKMGAIATTLLHALRWLHGYLGNWGLAIVALTLVIRLVFYPITYKSMVNMRVTQEKVKGIQPKLDRIKERYKKLGKDMETRQKMNEEMMKLYQKEGINPMANMAGCLPLLLQMPIFWALFKMLPHAYELRGAPFFGWMTDLSGPDTFFITPILCVATMFLSTKMSTTASQDPTQKSMLYFMPIMFGFFCLFAPTGLNVYWTTNNLLSMVQQRFINKSADRLKEGAKEDGGRGKRDKD